MRMGILIIWILIFAGMDAGYAQFKSFRNGLTSDIKAATVGDAVMILISEETEANNQATTNENRNTELSGQVAGSAGNTSFKASGGLGTGNNFNATGKTTRNENIRSRLSARVVEVDSITGNLKIEGKRTTKINGETQTVIISGFIRPVDILPNNSIFSNSILDLTLFIEGDGSVSKIQEPGLITKFLRLLF